MLFPCMVNVQVLIASSCFRERHISIVGFHVTLHLQYPRLNYMTLYHISLQNAYPYMLFTCLTMLFVQLKMEAIYRVKILVCSCFNKPHYCCFSWYRFLNLRGNVCGDSFPYTWGTLRMPSCSWSLLINLKLGCILPSDQRQFTKRWVAVLNLCHFKVLLV